MSKIKVAVTLTAYNMGPDATEADFDSFAALVANCIDEITGLDVSVDQHRFVGGPAEDTVTAGGGTYEEREDAIEVVREALRVCWDEWCDSGVPAAGEVQP